jgi:hypothetical protein
MRSTVNSYTLALLVSSCSSGGSAASPEYPDITGTWVVNLELSDKPGDLVERERPQGAPGSREQGEGGERRERMQIGIAILLQNSVAFKVEETDSSLTLTGAEGITRTFLVDGQERDRRIEGLGNVRVKARWRGDKLVIERNLEGGAKITEEFELARDGGQLFVKMKISGGPRSLEFRRVYDAADPGY